MPNRLAAARSPSLAASPAALIIFPPLPFAPVPRQRVCFSTNQSSFLFRLRPFDPAFRLRCHRTLSIFPKQHATVEERLDATVKSASCLFFTAVSQHSSPIRAWLLQNGPCCRTSTEAVLHCYYWRGSYSYHTIPVQRKPCCGHVVILTILYCSEPQSETPPSRPALWPSSRVKCIQNHGLRSQQWIHSTATRQVQNAVRTAFQQQTRPPPNALGSSSAPRANPPSTLGVRRASTVVRVTEQ